MSVAKDLEHPNLEPEDVRFPPGDLDSDEPPLESELHLRQILLLIQSLEWLWRGQGSTDRQAPYRSDFYAFGNLTIYYSPHQRKSEDFRVPDFFVGAKETDLSGYLPHPRLLLV